MKFITFYSVIKNIELYITLRIKTVLFIIHQIPILFFNYVQQHFDFIQKQRNDLSWKKETQFNKAISKHFHGQDKR